MSWSGGTFSRSTGATAWADDRAAGTAINATDHDIHDQDLADGINASVAKDGSNAFTGNADLGSNKITLMADGTALTDGATMKNVQNGAPMWGSTAGGSANTYTITLSPAITAYAVGQRFIFKVDAAKGATGASTLNVNGAGAKSIKKETTPDALGVGDMPAGHVCEVIYDGTQFILVNPANGNLVWSDWTPALGAGGAMTYTGTTIDHARYALSGSTCFYAVDFYGTTGGVADQTISFVLPVTPAAYYYGDTGYGVDNSASVVTVNVITGGNATVLVYKSDYSNWTLAADTRVRMSGFYEI